MYAKIAVAALFVGLATVMMSCAKGGDESSAPTFGDVKGKVGEAARAAGEYAYANKEQYEAKIRKELDLLAGKIETLEQQYEKSVAYGSEKSRAGLDEVRAKAALAREKLEQVAHATTETWDQVRAEAETALQGLSESVKRVTQEYNRK